MVIGGKSLREVSRIVDDGEDLVRMVIRESEVLFKAEKVLLL